MIEPYNCDCVLIRQENHIVELPEEVESINRNSTGRGPVSMGSMGSAEPINFLEKGSGTNQFCGVFNLVYAIEI